MVLLYVINIKDIFIMKRYTIYLCKHAYIIHTLVHTLM